MSNIGRNIAAAAALRSHACRLVMKTCCILESSPTNLPRTTAATLAHRDHHCRYAEAAKKCRAFDDYVRMYPPTGTMAASFR